MKTTLGLVILQFRLPTRRGMTVGLLGMVMVGVTVMLILAAAGTINAWLDVTTVFVYTMI